jgi:hypothetical protein
MDEMRLWNESQPSKYYWETPKGFFFLQELNQRSYKNEKNILISLLYFILLSTDSSGAYAINIYGSNCCCCNKLECLPIEQHILDTNTGKNCLKLRQISNYHWCWKHELHSYIDLNFDHQMSLSSSKCWLSNNCLHF